MLLLICWNFDLIGLVNPVVFETKVKNILTFIWIIPDRFGFQNLFKVHRHRRVSFFDPVQAIAMEFSL